MVVRGGGDDGERGVGDGERGVGTLQAISCEGFRKSMSATAPLCKPAMALYVCVPSLCMGQYFFISIHGPVICNLSKLWHCKHGVICVLYDCAEHTGSHCRL